MNDGSINDQVLLFASLISLVIVVVNTAYNLWRNRTGAETSLVTEEREIEQVKQLIGLYRDSTQDVQEELQTERNARRALRKEVIRLEKKFDLLLDCMRQNNKYAQDMGIGPLPCYPEKVFDELDRIREEQEESRYNINDDSKSSGLATLVSSAFSKSELKMLILETSGWNIVDFDFDKSIKTISAEVAVAAWRAGPGFWNDFIRLCIKKRGGRQKEFKNYFVDE